MLYEYQFDPALNLDKIFQCTPPPQGDFSKLPKLPKDWRAQLETIFYQVDKSLEKKSLEKHLGTDSGYELKKILAEQLQLIYYRLQGDLDAELGPLSDDHRIALLNKLIEEITECTPGFHNRVNVIVNSFQKPRNLDQLFYMLRKRIVEDVASSLSNEVHAHNQVSIIAAAEGFGIKPNFSNDPYTGSLSSGEIRCALGTTFQKKFTPFNLPCLLSHALMGLIPELEVEKNKATGLCLETTEKIVTLIQCYLPHSVTSDPLDWQKYFHIYTDPKDELKVCIVNVNWNVMYRYFYQELSKQHYFKQTPKINNLVDGAYYNLSLETPDPTDYESDYINQLFAAKNYFKLLAQLEELQARFPDYYQRVTGNPILIKHSPEFVPYLQQQFPNSLGYSSEFMQGFHLLTSLDLDVDEPTILKIVYALALKNGLENYTPLMLAARNDANIVEGMLNFLIQHQAIIGLDIYRQLFLEKNQADWNALMLAVRFRPVAAILILSFFDIHFLASTDNERKNFGINLLQQMFTTKQNDNYNVLMLAMYKPTEIVETLFAFMNKHVASFTKSTLQKLFTQKQDNNYTVLTLTASKQPEYVSDILSFIEKNIDNFDPEILQKLFFSSQQGTTCAALMRATNSQTEATQVILRFIHQHIENFNLKAIRQMFLARDGRQYTALMLAAQTHAESVEAILTFIEQHPKIFDAQLMADVLLAKDQFGTTALMLAAENQPKTMIRLLDFINKNIDTLDIQAIRELLFSEIHDYEASMGVLFGGKFNTQKTLLMEAERQHPEAASALLLFIDEHIQRLGTDILVQLLSETDTKDNNPFIRACNKHPTAMKGTLNFIANITEMGSHAFASLKIEIADLILTQLPRMSLTEPEEKTIVDKILLSNSPLLLAHFTKDYFTDRPANLAYITNQLFECYLEELEERKLKRIYYTTSFSFFKWRYSTWEKMDAAKELKKIVQLDPFTPQQLSALEKNSRYHWPLTESRLGNLFAAYCHIADNTANNLTEAHAVLDNNNTAPAPIERSDSSEASTYLKHSLMIGF
ncbi:MAG: hypothetical protein RLZZ225_1227 [Pseudomonadota bacterium]|jgi:ankyrin repeat protein